jgi:hypothetical protein
VTGPLPRRSLFGATVRARFATVGFRTRMAPQIRRTAVWRSVNFRTGRARGSLFQISTRRLAGHSAASAANSFSLVNLASPCCRWAACWRGESTDVVRRINDECFHHLQHAHPAVFTARFRVVSIHPSIGRMSQAKSAPILRRRSGNEIMGQG